MLSEHCSINDKISVSFNIVLNNNIVASRLCGQTSDAMCCYYPSALLLCILLQYCTLKLQSHSVSIDVRYVVYRDCSGSDAHIGGSVIGHFKCQLHISQRFKFSKVARLIQLTTN